MSLSSAIAAPRLSADVEVDAIERVAGMGVLVVSSAGNKYDPNTIGSPGTAPSMVTVGASYSYRYFLPPSLTVDGGSPVFATTTDNALPTDPVIGSLIDVATI
jgi:hypothetical protein